MLRPARWRTPVTWWLRERPDATIQLVPLSAPRYRAQQPSFVGTIEAEGSGSRVSGRVAPHALSIWVLAFLLLMDVFLAIGGVVQQITRHLPSQALFFALFGIVFASTAVGLLHLDVWWAAADVRQLFQAATSSDPHHAVEVSPLQAMGSIVSNRSRRSTRGASVLRFAAAIDLLIGFFLIASPFVSARVGRPVSLAIAVTLALGAAVLLVIANRLRSD